LDRWWREVRTTPAQSHLPFCGGWFIYLGYELAAEIEPRLKLQSPAGGLIATALRVPAAIVFEHDSGNACIVAEAPFGPLVEAIAADVAALPTLPMESSTLLAEAVAEDPPSHYISAVRRALDYISRGDIYQANLSRAWRGRLRVGVQPHDVYRRLRRTTGPLRLGRPA
jgi:anthranilate synthase component 1